jgi:hypothetical protein
MRRVDYIQRAEMGGKHVDKTRMWGVGELLAIGGEATMMEDMTAVQDSVKSDVVRTEIITAAAMRKRACCEQTIVGTYATSKLHVLQGLKHFPTRLRYI